MNCERHKVPHTSWQEKKLVTEFDHLEDTLVGQYELRMSRGATGCQWALRDRWIPEALSKPSLAPWHVSGKCGGLRQDRRIDGF